MNETLLSKNQQDVYEAQQQFWAALQSKNRKAFEHLLAEDFIGRSPGEPNQDRAAFIETLTGFPVQVRSVGSDNLEVHVFGTIAVLTGVQVAQLELANGQMKENRIAITNIFQQQNGRWLLKLAHAVALD
ncbi:MAG TPA: nuclear transport factor 2 family protein [Anaerolineales bacterium]|nr:nuclear transport factor 2 family protein [Anaerolineales bacterium]